MTSLGFENYAEALKIYLSKYREVSFILGPWPSSGLQHKYSHSTNTRIDAVCSWRKSKPTYKQRIQCWWACRWLKRSSSCSRCCCCCPRWIRRRFRKPEQHTRFEFRPLRARGLRLRLYGRPRPQRCWNGVSLRADNVRVMFRDAEQHATY